MRSDLEKPITKKDWMAQHIGLEFKPQYHKKEEKLHFCYTGSFLVALPCIAQFGSSPLFFFFLP
jgi:hypothetical protein